MWALVTNRQPAEPFTYRGRVVVHTDRAELEWLVPTHPAVQLPGRTPEEVAARLGAPVMMLKDHPDMAAVKWPLDRRSFR